MNGTDSKAQPTEREFQEKIATYRLLESRVDALARQQDAFVSKVAEINSTLAGIDEAVKSPADAMVPLGTAVYARGSVDGKAKLLVEVGAGVAVERTADEAKAILETRRKDLEQAIETLQKDMQTIVAMLQRIESETQAMMKAGGQR
jgi:prefoldin alpha subunit